MRCALLARCFGGTAAPQPAAVHGSRDSCGPLDLVRTTQGDTQLFNSGSVACKASQRQHQLAEQRDGHAHVSRSSCRAGPVAPGQAKQPRRDWRRQRDSVGCLASCSIYSFCMCPHRSRCRKVARRRWCSTNPTQPTATLLCASQRLLAPARCEVPHQGPCSKIKRTNLC